MDLTVSEDISQFFKQIWKILGIKSILKSDLIYNISYKLNLPYKPTNVVKKIKEAVALGILLEKNKNLKLNDNDFGEIKREQVHQKRTVKNSKMDNWDRIEDSFDPWMNTYEKKATSIDKKSLTLNTVVRKLIPKEILRQGTAIPASQFHYEIKEEVIRGTIDDTSELLFEIDWKNKTIKHNCTEFIDHLPEKLLCKHFYRIFMYMKKKEMILAKNVLLSLLTKKEEWKFQKS